MKKNIGNALALYPMPLVVVGAMVNGMPNWLLAGHVGIMGHDHVMVSLASGHYTNQGIKETKSSRSTLWTRPCFRRRIARAVSAERKTDKSGLFEYTVGLRELR